MWIESETVIPMSRSDSNENNSTLLIVTQYLDHQHLERL